MIRLAATAIRVLASAFRSRRDLLLENLALRQQLAILAPRRRPSIHAADRAFWVTLRRCWSGWADALFIVKPATVVRWHRAGFRLFWQRLSQRQQRGGRPAIGPEVRDLILRMAKENHWRAPRIHGELLHLGLKVSERSVSRCLRFLPRPSERRQSWMTFLRNHRDVLAAMDFLTVPTATFRILYVLFVIRHGRREIVHVNVTTRPTASWVIQQLREAFPFDTAAKYLVFDRDPAFSAGVVTVLRSMGINPTRTAFRSPWQNGVAERFVGTLRRELLDHTIVMNDRHLARLLREFVAYYHEDRTHLSLGKATPGGRRVELRPAGPAALTASPRVGGLHHRYSWRAAA
jgi:putative transposase